MTINSPRRKTKMKTKRRTPGSLSHGRPPTASSKPAASLSAKATRTLIRSHHQLHKARARALAENNEALVQDLDRQIASIGGLESYQLASKKGQSKERGGDSSKVLVEWLTPVLRMLKKSGDSKDRWSKLRLLEVGALSSVNACSCVGTLDVTRIDLLSREKGILQQDFMQRPLPVCENEKFHIISLSLVLNYVSDPAGRGEMLKRTTTFLAPFMGIGKGIAAGDATSVSGGETAGEMLSHNTSFAPCLFLVLPAACVLNSRYFTEERLLAIMSSLGYQMTQRKLTSKLIFYLWEYSPQDEERMKNEVMVFRKEMLNPGRNRNNFTITLC
ncbi:hypothetical protein PAAG_07384 [Paracoccidioides lutzii Pb01]|uniref:25S rRNA adenine-N(1) methyltransferase n=1 Tax=Paracoccidioides lutzii (strain ATCC MYA-826 / Pb01) TaxID=502779 RepID=C1H9E3_PARBA|nr:hypothetical protein PAAG_07384 [Paracoccidioides lutzii Pb01]EEH36966.1 hypothetical protein PAAG_07384 [Paracoccidioides lutzii Pb01]